MTNIGVFDSGLGGLAVLERLKNKHKANYFYLGDNKRVPYGGKTKEEIINCSKEIVNFLEKFDIDFYIIACNTISANAKDSLVKEFNKEFISIIDMGVESSLNENGDMYILATKATVASHIYKKKIEEKSDKKVIEVEAPKLVDLIEKGITEGDKLDNAIDLYIKEANEKKLENILLGCTHYPIIKKQIEKRLTYKANIIDPSIYLSDNISFDENKENKLEIYMTDLNSITESQAKLILNEDIKIKKAVL